MAVAEPGPANLQHPIPKGRAEGALSPGPNRHRNVPAGGTPGALDQLKGVARFGSAIAGILSTLAYLLPRSIGGPLQRASFSLRRGETTLQRAQQVSQQVGRLAPAGGQASTSARTPASATGGAQALTAVGTSPQGEGPVRMAPAASQAQVTPLLETAQTPFIEPGETLTVNLLIKPVKPFQAQHYSFTITSRSLEQSDAPPALEQGNVQVTALPWYRRYWLPALVTLLGGGLTFTLVWFLLTYIGVGR